MVLLYIMAFFDLAAAFASVSHALFAALSILKLPVGLGSIIDKLYENNKGYCCSDGTFNFMFNVLCGVMQGCPLSGSLFVIVIDPIMFLFEKYICQPGFGQILACADDLGGLSAKCGILRSFSSFSNKSEWPVGSI